MVLTDNFVDKVDERKNKIGMVNLVSAQNFFHKVRKRIRVRRPYWFDPVGHFILEMYEFFGLKMINLWT